MEWGLGMVPWGLTAWPGVCTGDARRRADAVSPAQAPWSCNPQHAGPAAPYNHLLRAGDTAERRYGASSRAITDSVPAERRPARTRAAFPVRAGPRSSRSDPRLTRRPGRGPGHRRESLASSAAPSLAPVTRPAQVHGHAFGPDQRAGRPGGRDSATGMAASQHGLAAPTGPARDTVRTGCQAGPGPRYRPAATGERPRHACEPSPMAADRSLPLDRETLDRPPDSRQKRAFTGGAGYA